MLVPRQLHTATLLADGRVLAVGGLAAWPTVTDTAEIYDPVTERWSATGRMEAPARFLHQSVLLPDGKVLVVGGFDGEHSAEIYDPDANRWESAGRLAEARMAATATLLRDGRVLVAGGLDDSGRGVATAEIHDPVRRTWRRVASMHQARFRHAAVVLPDGRVMVVAGSYGAECGVGDDRWWTTQAEIYDPEQDTWTLTGGIAYPAEGHVAFALRDKVVVVGTSNAVTIDRHDASGWTQGVDLDARSHAAAALLPDGGILLTGGLGPDGYVAMQTAIYDDVADAWRAAPRPAHPRIGAVATVLRDGSVLLSGGGVPRARYWWEASNITERFGPRP
jgi:hypothetical protein